ncbi:thiamine diphosphokinase [Isobaculum melis]|uniref:Thiamine diphosphokinase n=1 Tax=Isobaculum melis TaxID=142588 RepID=A0A1H9RB13_9LACT|nr:thiamine diphosphokinase [Isobaculum melis]SER69715.1 thiamine diphosphokinase [Isobaculum melis]
MKNVHILVGGPDSEVPDLMDYHDEQTIWIGVDRGAVRLMELGITPDYAVGDFDSISKAELAYLKKAVKEVLLLKAEKDETDTELALDLAIQLNPTKIRIFGATGGRLDHLLANLWIVLRFNFLTAAEKISLYDRQNSLHYFLPGHHEIQKEADKKYLAFVGLTAVKKLSLYDEKYQLDQVDFPYPISLASNEFIGETASFSFDEGIIAVIQSKD